MWILQIYDCFCHLFNCMLTLACWWFQLMTILTTVLAQIGSDNMPGLIGTQNDWHWSKTKTWEIGKHTAVKQFIDHGFYGFYLSKQTKCGHIARQATSAFSRHRFLMPIQSHRRYYCVLKMHSSAWLLVKLGFNQLDTDRFLYIWTAVKLFKIKYLNKLTNNFMANYDVDTALSTAALIRGHSA